MSYLFQDAKISKISVVGAGNIGPDICLHFAKTFVPEGVKFALVDISEQALTAARKKLEDKVNNGVRSGVFSDRLAKAIKESITYTGDYQLIAGSDIVLEAATENEAVKQAIFSQIEEICDDKCLLLSNSSHMEPEVIFQNIKVRGRCMVTHYFFPAERNPIVEVVPGKDTDPKLAELMLGIYEQIGKVPIRVKSSYSYAVDPIFEGLCQCAIMCKEKGLGNEKEIDAVACKTLGMGIGHFTTLTLAGGNPIIDHGLDEMHHKIMPWFRSPALLKEKMKVDGFRWDIAGRDEQVEVAEDKAEKIRNQYLGAYFGLSSFIMDRGIVDINDLDIACNIALDMKAPFSFMNEMGIDRAYKLVENFCAEHTGFVLPESLKRAREAGGWKLSPLICYESQGVQVIKIRRPKVLNALNQAVFRALKATLEETERNEKLVGTVLSGFGNKAFVSGADINMLAQCATSQQGYEVARELQQLTLFIEALNKPVVCAFNGIAFGGGVELAMACTDRICRKGLKTLVCQPEVNLGFIAGGGGTQRLPRLVGVEKAAEILRTGRPVSSAEALEIGLVSREVEANLQEAAVDLVKDIAARRITPKPMPKQPIDCPDNLPAQELGHLSRRIDEILVQAIVRGAASTLEEGLELEARLFGECIMTEDMKIGLENFMTNGPGVKACFVHR